jgi:hypothetical protein
MSRTIKIQVLAHYNAIIHEYDTGLTPQEWDKLGPVRREHLYQLAVHSAKIRCTQVIY